MSGLSSARVHEQAGPGIKGFLEDRMLQRIGRLSANMPSGAFRGHTLAGHRIDGANDDIYTRFHLATMDMPWLPFEDEASIFSDVVIRRDPNFSRRIISLKSVVYSFGWSDVTRESTEDRRTYELGAENNSRSLFGVMLEVGRAKRVARRVRRNF